MYRIVIVFSLVAAAVFGQTTNMTVVPAQTNAAVGIDWRYGRPGVFVVTNAAPAVTNVLAQRTITINGVPGSPASNLVFNIEAGGGNVASVNGQTGVVTITAAGLGALTNETDATALVAMATNRVKRLYYDFGIDSYDWLDGAGNFWRDSFFAPEWYLWTPEGEEVPVTLTGYPPNEGNWSGGDYSISVVVGVDGNGNPTAFRTFTVVNTVSGASWFMESTSGYADSFLIPPMMIATEPIKLYSNGGGTHVIDRVVRSSESAAWHASITNSTLDMGTNTVLAGALRTSQIAFDGTSLDFWYNGSPIASVEYDGVGIFNRIALSGTDPGFMPLVVGTTTRCDNLNADLLDGLHASSFQLESASPGVAFTNLAVDKANVALNNHLSTNEPHAGKYALQTGGTLTNATLDGTVTIGGVARTSWPEGGTVSIVTPITQASATITVSPTSSVYYVAVSSPSLITQDVSALALQLGQTAEWKTRVDITSWDATNGIAFAANIDTVAGDITVTGCYEFACATMCNGRIRMVQTYPEIQPWQTYIPYRASGTASLSYGGNGVITAGTTDGSYLQWAWPDEAETNICVKIETVAGVTTGMPAGSYAEWYAFLFDEGYTGVIYPSSRVWTNMISSSSSNRGGPVSVNTLMYIHERGRAAAIAFPRVYRKITAGDSLSTNCAIFVNASWRRLTALEKRVPRNTFPPAN